MFRNLLSLLRSAKSQLIGDRIRYRTEWTIRKYADDKAFEEGRAYEEVKIPGNIMLNEGIAEMLDLLIAAGTPTNFNNSNAYIGVGDNSGSEAASQTDLLGTNKTYKAMSATYPQRSGQTVTWRASFASADANYAWNEFTVANGSSGTAKNLNRKVSAQGTKASGQTWTVDVAITWS